jgi:hypothetical protein
MFPVTVNYRRLPSQPSQVIFLPGYPTVEDIVRALKSRLITGAGPTHRIKLFRNGAETQDQVDPFRDRLEYEISPKVTYTLSSQITGPLGQWVFFRQTQIRTIREFLANFVFFCPVDALKLAVVGSGNKPVASTLSSTADSLKQSGTVNVKMTRRQSDVFIRFKYKYERPGEEVWIMDEPFKFDCPHSYTREDACEGIAKFMGTVSDRVTIYEPNGDPVEAGTKMREKFALQTLTFTGARPLVSDQESLRKWERDLTKYACVRVLGKGTFGEVFLGEDRVTKAQVAIKVFSLARREREVIQKNFDREVLQLISCNHPCVHSIIGWQKPNDDEIRLATELMEHGSIADVVALAAQGRAPPEWNATARARMLVGTAMGMNYIHGRGLVHRDLKPANVFIDKDWNPRVGDLGACRYQDAAMTLEVGTPLYCAPEVMEFEAYDQSVDVFSFGMMSWEVITGKSLQRDVFPGLNIYSLPSAIKGGRRPPPAGVDGAVAELLSICWDVAPSARPTFADILQCFKAVNYKICPGADGDEIAAYVLEIERIEKRFCH